MGTVTKPLVPSERTLDESSPVSPDDGVTRLRRRSRALADAHRAARSEAGKPSVLEIAGIADNVPGVVFRQVVRPDGTVTFPYVSAGARSLGVDPEAVLSGRRGLFDAVHEDDRPVWDLAVRRSTEEVAPLDCTLRMVTGEGSLLWVRAMAHPSVGEGGDVVFDGYAHDVTDRIETRQALKESEERFRNLIEGSIEGIAIIANSEPVFVNQAFADMFGYQSPEEVLAAGPAGQVIAHEDIDRISYYYWARLGGQDVPVNYEFRGQRRDGTLIWVECKARVVRWGGQPASQVTLFDITDRKRAEEELRKFRSIVEASGESIAIADVGGTIQYVNPAFERLFGRRVMPRRTLNVRDNFAPDTVPIIDNVVVPALVHQGGWEGVLDACHVSGRRFPLWVKVEMVRDAAGKPVLSFGLMHDYSAEQQHRTELQAAKESADAANRAKSKFLAAASHDLRQPLHALSIFLGVLASKMHGREALGVVRQMEQALKSAQRLLNSVLDMSRLEAGVIAPSIIEFPIQELLNAMEVEFGAAARARGLEFEVKPCSIVVRSDPDFLTAIARNLLSNAVTYTQRGRVVIGCRRCAGGVELQVCDTGPGIAPEDHALIFEEFRRGEAGQGEGEGLGLGLAIARRMADMLGSRIRVRSILGRGSQFSIRIPRAPVSRDDRRTGWAAPLAVPDPLPGSRVLILSTLTTASTALSKQLEAWDCRVIGVYRAVEALTLAKSGVPAPDVVIGDCTQLMTESGLDMLDHLITQWGGDIPRIVVVGAKSPKTLKMLHDRGIYALSAPAEPARLRALLSHAVARRPARSTAATPA
jgi:PAS domain S-box-containing protein